MKIPAAPLLLILLCLSATGALFAAKDKGLDVLISADAIPSPEGFRPQPGKPIYYLLFKTKETLGEPVAGIKLPTPEVMEKTLVAELDKQGFKRAVDGGPPPEIAIFAIIGDSNFRDEIPNGNPWNDDNFRLYLEAVNVRDIYTRIPHFGARPDQVQTVAEIFQDGAEPLRGDTQMEELRSAIINEARRLRNLDPARKRNVFKTLVGADKIEHATASRTLSSTEAEKIAQAGFDDRFYVSLTAVDVKKLPDGSRRFLWRTTMFIDWREDFTKVLPTMLAQAGPMFGTDVTVPGIVNTARPEGKVEIGDTKVVKDPDADAKKK